MRTARFRLAAVAVTTSLLAACGSGSDDGSSSGGDGHYPVTVSNCGHDVTIEAAPERVVLLKSALVPMLDAVGALDTVESKAGAYPPGYYSGETAKKVAKIPSLTGRMDAAGHLLISREAVVEREPDLVLGHVENLDHAALEKVGIPSLEADGLCDTDAPDPSFDEVYQEVHTFGKVFDKKDQAEKSVAELKKRVEAATQQPNSKGKAVVLYPTVGGGTTYAYGNKSMADPQVKAAGYSNVFGDVSKRVFEVTPEQIIAKDPDFVVLLYSEGDPAAVRKAFTGLPGASGLKAVREGRIVTQLFNFTEPASPLAVTGLEKLVAAGEK